MSERTHCRRGHELTADNIRRRGGDRANRRECLTCHRRWHARRDRRGLPNDPRANLVQQVRRLARRRFLTATHRDGQITLTMAGTGTVVFSGPMTEAHDWMVGRFRRRDSDAPAVVVTAAVEAALRIIDGGRS